MMVSEPLTRRAGTTNQLHRQRFGEPEAPRTRARRAVQPAVQRVASPTSRAAAPRRGQRWPRRTGHRRAEDGTAEGEEQREEQSIVYQPQRAKERLSSVCLRRTGHGARRPGLAPGAGGGDGAGGATSGKRSVGRRT